MVVIVGISEGKFTVSSRSREDGAPLESALTPEALCEVLQTIKYDVTNDNHALMCSSSVDFPEEDGAPEGFDGRGTINEAIVLMFPEDRRADVRAALPRTSVRSS